MEGIRVIIVSCEFFSILKGIFADFQMAFYHYIVSSICKWTMFTCLRVLLAKKLQSVPLLFQQVLRSCSSLSLFWSFELWLQQMALAGLLQSKGRQPSSPLSFFKDKRDFFSLPQGDSTLPCQSRIRDWISARSASCCFRWTTDRSRVEIRRVWSSPSFRTPHMHLFLPSSQRHLRWREALAWQALNRPACAECKLGGCPSLPCQLSRKEKKGGKTIDGTFRMQ